MTRIGLLTSVSAALAIVLAAASVVAWTDAGTPAKRSDSSTRVTLVAQDGAQLFRAKGCATCHRGPDSEPLLDGPPDLSDAGAWAGTRREGLDAAAYIRESIRDPSAFRSPEWRDSGWEMPTLPVNVAELDAIVEYLLACGHGGAIDACTG
jgi:mono/diheme cytochrome c family protein